MKKKKEIEIPKDKYIYQRYNGIITKYIVDKEYYIAIGTGITTKKNETVLLGKVAENIIDLIEVGDYVNGYRILNIVNLANSDKKVFTICKSDFKDICRVWGEEDIETILTHEQMEENQYVVKRNMETN